MSHLKYSGTKLFVENTSIFNLAKKNKTPFYVYSEGQIKENYLKLAKIFKSTKPLICFAFFLSPSSLHSLTAEF